MSKKKIAFLSVSVALLLSLLGGALFGQATQKNNVYRYLSIFTEVFDLVRNNYVEQVPPDQLMDGAFSGVTDAIDEFSYYVPPAQMAAYKNFSDVEDNGVGLIVTKRFGYAFVIAAVPGSPAAKSGIERGDFIEKIDGQPTQKMAVWQVRNLLRATKPVHVQVLRGGQTKRDDFTLQQASFHPLPLTTEQYGGVAYVKIPYFEKGTAAQLATSLENIRKSGNRKLIIDLRGNAGGDVDEAITSADELLTSGMITSIEGRKVDAKKWQADRNTAYDGDLEVLTDGSTASGAEIFAAAIHGNQRGKVVGVTTYGKSIVQRFIPLPSGGGVFMTVAHYTTPDMKAIKAGGIRPDVIVDLTSLALRDPDAKGTHAEATKPKDDLILQKALQLFSEPAAKKAA
ncbi:MAG TPA: S41 family peptidase [Thermoanaerobaculia bacterium]|jgi:carboxyl-terminal processing protease|nr:S41 family peptidase [Thermoanaerobaculia bacterium]